jgi:CheY-like chemotaxis protein
MSITSPAASHSSTQNSRSALKVLVIDDDPFQLEFIADTLKSLGVSDITLAESGNKALQAVTASQGRSAAAFDLMLCDLHMPGMDGFQYMASAAQSGFKGALIIVSGQDSKVVHSATLVAQLRRFNLLGTLQKPVDSSALSGLISKIAS